MNPLDPILIAFCFATFVFIVAAAASELSESRAKQRFDAATKFTAAQLKRREIFSARMPSVSQARAILTFTQARRFMEKAARSTQDSGERAVILKAIAATAEAEGYLAFGARHPSLSPAWTSDPGDNPHPGPTVVPVQTVCPRSSTQPNHSTPEGNA